jgi:RNA polymerase sigma-70 factor, ECF subfamily
VIAAPGPLCSLLAAIQAGAADGWDRLIAVEGGYLRAVARSVLGPGPLAEDAVQDALMDLTKGISGVVLQDDATARTWLRRVVAHAACDIRASEQARHRRERVWADARPEHTDVPAETDGLDRALLAALADLQPQHRDILADRFLAGRSVAQVAAARGISASAVKMATSRAVANLRQRLSQRGRPVSLGLIALWAGVPATELRMRTWPAAALGGSAAAAGIAAALLLPPPSPQPPGQRPIPETMRQSTQVAAAATAWPWYLTDGAFVDTAPPTSPASWRLSAAAGTKVRWRSGDLIGDFLRPSPDPHRTAGAILQTDVDLALCAVVWSATLAGPFDTPGAVVGIHLVPRTGDWYGSALAGIRTQTFSGDAIGLVHEPAALFPDVAVQRGARMTVVFGRDALRLQMGGTIRTVWHDATAAADCTSFLHISMASQHGPQRLVLEDVRIAVRRPVSDPVAVVSQTVAAGEPGDR